MANLHLKRTVLQVLDNQLQSNELPVVNATFDRLKKAGNSEKQAKEKMAAVLLGEIYDVLKNKESFNEERYTRNLNGLE